MSQFGSMILTNKGRNLQSKAQTGTDLLFTKIGVGDGDLNGTAIQSLNNLISLKKSLQVTKLKAFSDGKAVIGTVLSNQDITNGFYFKELGIFAQDPDIGEILYCYANAGDLGEYIPAGGGPDVIEKVIDIFTIVGNASNVTASIDTSVVYETQLGAQEKADQAAMDAINWAKSFGLGGGSKDIKDWNLITESGFYMGNINGPFTSTMFMGFHVQHSNSDYATQIVQRLGRVFTRNKENGVIGDWLEIPTLNKNGVLTLPKQSYVEVSRTSSLSISSSVAVKVTGLSEQSDRQGEFTADAMTIKESGVYAVYTYAAWAGMNANRISTIMYVNGNNIGSITEHNTAGVSQTSYGVGTILREFTAGEKIEFYVYQNSGVTSSIGTFRARVVKIA